MYYEILQAFLRKFVLVFLDDILIYSNSWEEHIQQLKQVLDNLREHQLYLKPSKCTFGQDSLEYFGHVICSKGLSTDPSKISAMIHWPAPTTITELRAFLGLTQKICESLWPVDETTYTVTQTQAISLVSRGPEMI